MTVGRRVATVVPLFALFTAVVVIVAPAVGSTPISLSRAFNPRIPWTENVDAQIFFIARLPRVVAGAMVGATLAAAGVVLQALLRNPLATPFTLGISTGAGLGAILAIAFELDAGPFGAVSVPTASFAGALLATSLVYFLATQRTRRALDQRAPACRRHAQLVLLGDHHVRAVPESTSPTGTARRGGCWATSTSAASVRSSPRCRCSSRRSCCSPCCRARSTC